MWREVPTLKGLGAAYWKLLVGGGASNLADGIRLVAYPWLASTLTREPALVAGAAVAARLPWLLLSLPLLYAAAIGMGVAEVVYDNAAQTILPKLVPAESLERANGHLWSVEMVANEFAGPPLGGALIAVGLAVTFFADAAGMAVAVLAVALIGGVHRAERESDPDVEPARRSLRREIAEGVAWLRAHSLLRTLAVLLGAMNMVAAGTMAVLVLFAQEVLGLSAGAYGLLRPAVRWAAWPARSSAPGSAAVWARASSSGPRCSRPGWRSPAWRRPTRPWWSPRCSRRAVSSGSAGTS